MSQIRGRVDANPTTRHVGFIGHDLDRVARTASYAEREARAAAARGVEQTEHMTTMPSYVEENGLLAALPVDVLTRLTPNLALVPLHLGKVLYEPGVEPRHVYFPITGCIVSMLYLMQDGSSAETASVGDEGVVGIALFMGGDSSPNTAVVQSAGQAVQLEAKALKSEFGRSSSLKILLLRYTQALIAQTAQTAVCNRHHSLEQQLCRWLLRSQDRLPTNQLKMTHELMANMLGVRREGVTQAAGKLQRSGLIRYNRGSITILDRPGLEGRACECYDVVKKEYRRLLPSKPWGLAHMPASSRPDVIYAGAWAAQARVA